MRRSGAHSSSRALGRSAGTAPPVEPVPSASIAVADPGAMVDSPTSKRSTAKRVGAVGSTGGEVGEPAGDGDGTGLAAVVGAGDASMPTGLTVYTPRRSVWQDDR